MLHANTSRWFQWKDGSTMIRSFLLVLPLCLLMTIEKKSISEKKETSFVDFYLSPSEGHCERRARARMTMRLLIRKSSSSSVLLCILLQHQKLPDRSKHNEHPDDLWYWSNSLYISLLFTFILIKIERIWNDFDTIIDKHGRTKEPT